MARGAATRGALCGMAALLLAGPAGPAAANAVFVQSPVNLGTVVTIGGTVQLTPDSDSVGGSGALGVQGFVSRGRVVVTRSAPAVVTATIDAAPATLQCAGMTVPVTFSLNDSNCGTVASGSCTIYIGATAFIPGAPTEGGCSAPDLVVNLMFSP